MIELAATSRTTSAIAAKFTTAAFERGGGRWLVVKSFGAITEHGLGLTLEQDTFTSTGTTTWDAARDAILSEFQKVRRLLPP